MNLPPPPRLDLVTACVLFALSCVLASALMNHAAYINCMNHAGGLACRVFQNEAGNSWIAASGFALGIAFRQRQ